MSERCFQGRGLITMKQTYQVVVKIEAEEPPPHGQIVALNVDADVYLEKYEGHYEWVRGYVIEMSPVTEDHLALTDYIGRLLDAYLVLQPIGVTRKDPFVMRLPTIPALRQPDLQVILGDNQQHLTPTAMNGPADICIEIVSVSSAAVDYDEKFSEYERGGVQEYWIIDPLQQTAQFYHTDAAGQFEPVATDGAGIYRTPRLPAFQLDTRRLWERPLPHYFAVGAIVQAWFE